MKIPSKGSMVEPSPGPSNPGVVVTGLEAAVQMIQDVIS
jgi:hypothetical protein